MRSIILMALITLGSLSLCAQTSFIISYPISFPMGNLHDYSSKTSFRGISLEFLKKATPQMFTGIETGWNVFYQRVESKEYKQGTASITGTQFRYTNVVPIIAGLKYYPAKGTGSKKATNPYVGIGLGTLYANRSTDFGLYRITSDAWQFCVRPELGIELKAGADAHAFVGVKYYWSFNAGDLDGQRFLSINIGIRTTAL